MKAMYQIWQRNKKVSHRAQQSLRNQTNCVCVLLLLRIQTEWLIKELENGKLCAKETVLVTAHAFHTVVQGPELPPALAAAATESNNNSNPQELSDSQKKRFVEILAKHPPRMIVTSQGPANQVVTVHTAVDPNAATDEEDSPPVLKKTQMVVCSSPTMTIKDTVLHVAHVTQSGIAVTQIHTTGIKPKQQDIDVAALSVDTIKLELSRGESLATSPTA